MLERYDSPAHRLQALLGQAYTSLPDTLRAVLDVVPWYRRLEPEHTGAKALVLGSLASVVAFHVEGLFEHSFGASIVVTLVYFLMALPFVVQCAHVNDAILASSVAVSRQT